MIYDIYYEPARFIIQEQPEPAEDTEQEAPRLIDQIAENGIRIRARDEQEAFSFASHFFDLYPEEDG
jgi:hypothetical protein